MMKRWPCIVGGALLLSTGAAVAAEDVRIFQGKPGFTLAGPDNAIKDARVGYLRALTKYRSADRLDADPKQVKRAVGIVSRLVEEAVKLYPFAKDWDWELHVATDKEPNAFCMAGGKMLINSSILLHFQKDDAAVAAVLGHEIAHALLEHIRSRMDRALMQNGIQWMLTRSLRVGSIGATSIGYGEKLGRTLPMGRQAELDADTLGVEIAARAGFDPTGGIRFFEWLSSVKGKSKTDFEDTHPLDERRVDNLKRLQPLVEAMMRVEGRR